MKTKRTRKNNHEAGLALLALLAIMIILGIVGYTFVNIISTEQIISGAQYNSTKAFYITEGALEIGKKYVFDQEGVTPDWAPDADIFDDEPLGDGTFDLRMYWPDNPGEFINFTATAEVD